MKKFFQQFMCSRRSVAFTLVTGVLISLLAFTPASAFAKTNHNAYVINNIEGTVSVIDTRTNTITATISGFTHPFNPAVSPNGKLLYVRNSNNTISVVDTETNTISATIAVHSDVGNEGAAPTIVFNRHGERAYVAISQGFLQVINVECNTVLNTVALPAGFGPVAIAISRDGDSVYLGSGQGLGIDVVDADTLTVTSTIAPGHLILDLATSPDGRKLYASDSSALLSGISGVLVVNAENNTLEATIPLPVTFAGPAFVTGLAVTPDGRHLYVEDFFFSPANSTVSVIDTHDNHIETTISAPGQSLTALAIARNGEKVLVTNSVLSLSVASTVEVIDTRTNTIADSITVGHFDDGIATQPSRGRHDDDDHDRDHDHDHYR